MKFHEVLPHLTHGGAQIFRTSEPGDHYELDAAEQKLRVWKYWAEEDELIEDWKFDAIQLCAIDWEWRV